MLDALWDEMRQGTARGAARHELTLVLDGDVRMARFGAPAAELR
ncbi:hypothetical protein [Sorangium sp. So ce233]